LSQHVESYFILRAFQTGKDSLGLLHDRDAAPILSEVVHLADYHRQRPRDLAPVVKDLVRRGRLRRVEVERWRSAAFVSPDLIVPRRVEAQALVSPFDPVVWHRPRAERVFDFDYRLALYTPAPKRRFGYYVMPFVMGDRLAARVDLCADRSRGHLLVPGAFAEDGVDRVEVARALVVELDALARWLDLDEVRVGDRGDLIDVLRRTLSENERDPRRPG